MTCVELDDLIARLPDGAVLTDADLLEGYRQDWAREPDAGVPLAVVRATSTDDVAATLRFAHEHKIAVVPRGAGSGLSGGATAVEGGIVLSTERMRAIAIDPVTRTAVVQPGLLNAEVKRAVAEEGLWYPPDPSSFEICSIGGNAATNAGGLCCVKYGVTTDYVLGMEVVLADGTVVRLGGPRLKDSAGLSLTKLFVGSEGTLGVITELTLRLLPAQPPQSTVVASFATLTAATDAILGITGKLRPSMLEFMDAVAINAVEDEMRMGLTATRRPCWSRARTHRANSPATRPKSWWPCASRRAPPRSSTPRTPRRAKPSPPHDVSPFRRWSGWDRCCWRTSECRCRASVT